MAAPGRCLHELIAGQAARTPGAVALVFEDRTLTYAELDRRTNRLARCLAGLGVGPEVRVGVCMERSFEMVVALLGTLKAGGAYVPVDPSYPAERIDHMLTDSGVPVLLTQERFRGRLPEHGALVLCLDRDWPRVEAESPEPFESGAGPESLAYVIYTSGSTGRPKGAMNTHRSVANRLLWGEDRFGLTGEDVMLQKTPFSFDVSVPELFGPLLAGARMVLARPDGHRDPAYLSETIERERVTTIHFVPSMLRAFLEAGEPYRCGSLRRVSCSGEALTPELRDGFFELFPGVELHNLYGPTEAAVEVTHHECVRGAGGMVPLGRPVANTQVHVLDGMLSPVPWGVAGELYIGGVQVGRGYLNRPDLTAERFVADPFSPEPGGRLYRSGDRARWRADGTLEYLGRLDFQVKIRGFRIEVGEVEAALRALPAVREAVVAVQESAAGEMRLVAYVAGEAAALASGTLRSVLERTLPAHMIPSVFVRLDELPLLPNGKVDRNALPKPGAWERAREHEAPSTYTEQQLAAIWEEVLDTRPVGVDDDFFALGGHSLAAVRLMTQVRRRFGTEIPLSEVFRSPTVRSLAVLVDHKLDAEPWSPLVPIQPHGDRVPIFFVHPFGGQVLCYADLARHLGRDQPFYGLMAPDLVRVEEEVSIEEMASGYVAAVRAVRPRGPYLIGGWSFGGHVAFEMARQLTGAGEPVALLAMLDTPAPGGARQGDGVEEELSLLLHVAEEEAARSGKPCSLTAEELRPLDPESRIVRTLEAIRGPGAAPGDVEVSWVRAFLRGTEVRRRAESRYTPGPYDGQVTLFLPSEQAAGAVDPDVRKKEAKWAAYCSTPPLTRVVPGNHGTMVTGDHAAVLAGHIRALSDAGLRR